jgi:hypothetical protein
MDSVHGGNEKNRQSHKSPACFIAAAVERKNRPVRSIYITA